MKAQEYWNTLTHCCGYPDCDGDLVAIEHSEKCPLFGEKELNRFEFAEQYAREFAAEQLEALAESVKSEVIKRDKLKNPEGDDFFLSIKRLAVRAADLREESNGH